MEWLTAELKLGSTECISLKHNIWRHRVIIIVVLISRRRIRCISSQSCIFVRIFWKIWILIWHNFSISIVFSVDTSIRSWTRNFINKNNSGFYFKLYSWRTIVLRWIFIQTVAERAKTRSWAPNESQTTSWVHGRFTRWSALSK